MSDLFGIAATASVTLTASTAKTTVQILAPANHRVKILGWGVYFDGVTSTNIPVRVRVLRQTTAGTMSALTPTKTTPRAEGLLTTAQHTASAEPTAGDVIDIALVHPQQGYEVKFSPGQELVLGGAERVGIELLAVSGVNAITKIFFEE